MTSSLIAVLSSSKREALALTSLTSALSKATSACNTLGHFRTLLRRVSPAVVVTRSTLDDGYSDDVLAVLAQSGLLPGTAVIVLAKADCTSKQEARQLDLGADCILKDPLRPDVLLEYMRKFLRAQCRGTATTVPPNHFTLAGATIIPERRTLTVTKKTVHLSPKEIELARLLAESGGKMLTYEVIYSELFGRAFSGDSANGRVLLGKLATSFRKVRIDLRAQIQVTPKLGFRYSPSKTERQA